MRDVVFLVIGLILGFAVDRGWELAKPVLRARRDTARSDARIDRDRSLRDAALRYARRPDVSVELYQPTFVNPAGGVVPMAIDDSVHARGQIDIHADTFLRVVDANRAVFPFDPQVIESRQRAGAKLWDGSILYATGADSGSDDLTAVVGNYFAYVSMADRIQAAYSRQDRADRIAFLAASIGGPHFMIASPNPVAVAAATTTVFETPDGPVFLLSKRSTEVVNALGSNCVVPTFGFESNALPDARSEYGVIFYNFIKEFLEEIFGFEELEAATTYGHLDPDTIFDSPLAARLISEFAEGRATLHCTGLGVEMTDATITYGLCAHFQSVDFWRIVRRHAKANFETLRTLPTDAPLSFVPLRSVPTLDLTTMSATSTFSLDLAIKHGGYADLMTRAVS